MAEIDHMQKITSDCEKLEESCKRRTCPMFSKQSKTNKFLTPSFMLG